MKQTIPTAVATRLIDAQMQAEAALARDLVLIEGLALITGHLHRAGLVDADRLATELVAVFEQPQPPGFDPQLLSDLAELVGGRMRGAAQGAKAPAPPGSV